MKEKSSAGLQQAKTAAVGRPKEKAKVLHEALVYAGLEAAGLPVPKVCEVAETPQGWQIRLEEISGTPLQQSIRQDPQNLPRYIRQMVQLQVLLHTKTAPLPGTLRQRLSRQIHQADCLSDAQRYEMLLRLQSLPDGSSLCHGGFSPQNLVVTPDKTYIVGWQDASLGAPAADAAQTYLLLSLQLPQGAELYLAEYSGQSGIAKREIQSWMPVVAAARLACGHPQEQQHLLCWADVVQYA